MNLDTDEIVAYVRNWSLGRIDSVNHEYAQALYEEFEGWIDLDNVEDIEVVSLESLEGYYKD
jgi:SH3-like domain-containing protein